MTEGRAITLVLIIDAIVITLFAIAGYSIYLDGRF